MTEPNIQEAVKQKYRDAAKGAASGGTACCGGGAQASCDPITKDLYTDAEKGALPEKAVAASLGCGNPGPSLNCNPAKPFWISARGAALTSFFPPNASAPPAKLTAWT